jgi:hypothetical protein
MDADNEFADVKRQELIDKLKGISVTTEVMQNGTDYENLLCAYMDGKASLDDGDALTPVIKEMAGYVRGGIRQLHVKTRILPNVILHGYIDFLNRGTVYDVKTTNKYEFPKYLHRNQHLAYLAALRPQGIDTFKYLITDFKDCFIETYHWRERYLGELKGQIDDLLEYLKIDHELSEAFYLKAEADARKYHKEMQDV